MSPDINLRSVRARKARLARHFQGGGVLLLLSCCGLALVGAVYCFTLGDLAHLGYFATALASALSVLLLWYRYELRPLPASPHPTTLTDVIEPHLLARLTPNLTPRSAWELATKQREGLFISHRFMLPPSTLTPVFSEQPQDMVAVWEQAIALLANHEHSELHAGTLAAAILLSAPTIPAIFAAGNMSRQDILECTSWLNRQLGYSQQARPHYGGIGRDWASGYTPMLDQFGENISLGLEAAGGSVRAEIHPDLITKMATNLSQGNPVALVGQEGVGKSELAVGLANHLLQGQEHRLQYYQIISLNASIILSNAGGELERIMLTLIDEAYRAGNIILFLDDAHLFFGAGAGAFDMSQILLPLAQNHRVKLVTAFGPAEWQQLQSKQSALTSSFAVLTVEEPVEAITLQAIQDNAVTIEYQSHTFISYEATREAYRLSGQYLQEYAYPGKAIMLLEQAVPYASSHQVISAQSVQKALEKSRGVRVMAAEATEADTLLHLEDRIHERMINQKRAVSVVADALRRGRAGVTSPKRPLGSFLFLGPTGVGKTELARSLAAVYFGSEQQMVRLDMSEYQQPEDVKRLLATGGSSTQSLLLAIREQPFTVVLLDEIEKAHPNILNLFLQLLDEGQLTDEQGRPASFRSSIIIATSNAGAADIAQRVKDGQSLDDFERPLIDKLIANGQFKPELMNRFDEIVLFRPLNEDELGQVAAVMLAEVNRTLQAKGIAVELSPEALKFIVHAGYDPEFGARPMRRIIQKTVENAVAVRILEGKASAGTTIHLDIGDVNPANQKTGS